MVLHANNGVLLPPVMEVLPEGGAVNSTSNDLGNWNTQVVDDTAGQSASSSDSEMNVCSKTQEIHLVAVSDGNGCNSEMGADTFSGSEKQVVGVGSGFADKGSGDDPKLVGDTESQPWPKCKRLPVGAPTERPARTMGAIERALRNSSTRKTKYVFEPTLGMTFDCVAEAVEFYNIYSWEVGFGTKRGDKYGNSMQELQCQCQGV